MWQQPHAQLSHSTQVCTSHDSKQIIKINVLKARFKAIGSKTKESFSLVANEFFSAVLLLLHFFC